MILATAKLAGADERLRICAVSWLTCYHDFVDGRRLSELAQKEGALVRAYLGVMLSLAIEAPEGAGRAPQFEAALAHYRPLKHPRVLYDVVESILRLRKWTKMYAMPFYRRWGFWHDDMSLKRVSVNLLARLLSVPEWRVRAPCGPSLEAAFIARTAGRATNARCLSREVGVSYAAAHAAVELLVGREMFVRKRGTSGVAVIAICHGNVGV